MIDLVQPDLPSWAIYRIRASAAQFIGIVYDQLDPESAITAAIEKYKMPLNQRHRMIAQRRG